MQTALRWFYGVLAVLGVVLPWHFNIQWMQTPESTGVASFVSAGMANAASSSLTVDILIVFVCFSVWVVVEGRRLGMRYAWLFIPYATFIALASAFPLFLLLRSRRMQTLAEGGATA